MKRKLIRLSALTLAVFFACSLGIFAASGDLDPTFGGGGGYVMPDVGPASGPANASILQPDGKLLAGGNAYIDTPNGNNALIVRYNPDGTLDTSFDTDGKVYVAIGFGEEVFYALALQPDGKIVGVGTCQVGVNVDFMVVRLNPNGSFDTTFGGGDGIATTNIRGTTGHDIAFGLAIQRDGKIVAVGRSETTLNGEKDSAIVRYNPDGSLDTTFDGDGILVKNFAPGETDAAASAAIQLDGKIVMSGNFAGYAGVARFNADGTTDTSFNNGGVLWSAFMASGSCCGIPFGGSPTVTIQWDGKILFGGDTSNGYDFAVARLNPNGSYDNTFGVGAIYTNISGFSTDHLYSLSIQSDGKILAAGFSDNIAPYGVFSLIRLNPNGSLDTSFSNDGIVFTEFGGSYDYGFSVASVPDGRVIVGGLISGKHGIARYQGSPTPATAKIGGRVVNAQGRGIPGARVILTNTQSGSTKIITTNPFGYYNFRNLPTGINYTITVSSKRNQFDQSAQSLQLFMDVLGLHFVGNR